MHVPFRDQKGNGDVEEILETQQCNALFRGFPLAGNLPDLPVQQME